MLYPVEKLLGNQKLASVSEQETVRDALTKMLEHDYSQLPIMSRNGELSGIISEQSIARSYYHVDEKVSVLDLKVNNCRESPVTISIEQDVFELLDLLKQVYAVVVLDGRQPVGILTNYDTTNFFRDFSEGLILVEDIEVTLRQYIDEALPNDEDRNEAMFNAFKHLMKGENPTTPSYDHLTFGDYITLITNSKNWEKFEEVLESRDLFRVYMNQVRDIRNQLAHFRGRLDAIQYDILKRVRDWLANRPIVYIAATPAIIVEPPANYDVGQAVGKYGRLENWLKSQGRHASSGADIQQSFAQIEELINDKLPPSAKEHRAWWANDPSSGRHSMAWLRAGWRVENVDFSSETVIFRRTDSVLYHVFYNDLLFRLKEERPGLTRATKTWPYNWWNFGGGRSGMLFGWAFGNDNQFRTELYFDTGDKDKNKQYFDLLFDQKEDIEFEFGKELFWQRMDDHVASRVFTSIPATIRDDPDKLEETKVLALENIQTLVDVFQKRIKKLPG